MDKVWYNGKVTSNENNMNSYHPHVLYDDGDEEDVRESTIYEVLKVPL